jgi:hypothetical protein
MKVDRKQFISYPWLILLIILTAITVALEQSMAEKVFSPYDSRIIHEKECKELDLSEHLIEFPSVQQAVASGALPCKFCMGQYTSNSGNQQFNLKKQINSSVTGSTTRKYNPQPIVARELSTLYGVARFGSLYMFAEDYANHSRFDFSNANLRAVQVTLQNTSYDNYEPLYQFHFTDFHGIGNEEYMPYPYQDAFMLMDNSIAFEESVKGAKTGALRGAAIGATFGAALGLIGGDPLYAAYAAAHNGVLGGAIGGFTGYYYYKEKATLAVDNEVQSRIMPDNITVQPGSKITGVLFFPEDTHTIRINIEGVNYDFSIHN